jgi:hypothetical protein
MAQNVKEKVLLAYSKLAQKLNTYPSRSVLIKNGISRDVVRHHFGSMESLRELAKDSHPEYFENVIDPENFSQSVFDEIKNKAKKYKRFVVTTAVAGAPVHDKFLSSLKNFCKEKNAMLLLIPANYALYEMDPDVVNDENINIVFKPLKLNSNIYIDPIRIDPKQVDPAVGLDALGQTDGTVIIGSPKQRRVSVANSNLKLARIIQSTGAITKPMYVPRDGHPKRRDRLAEAHHKMGALVIEIVDNNYFHFRAVQMSKDGSFNERGKKKYVDEANFLGYIIRRTSGAYNYS